MTGKIPAILIQHLQILEPNADFLGGPPCIRSTGGQRYFGKVGSPNEIEQYTGEVESLKAMAIAAPDLAPRVLAFGIEGSSGNNESSIETRGRPFFLSEYKDLTHLTNDAAQVLGKRLATELHMYKSTNGFGFDVPTYCGATRLKNGWFETWEQCYSSMIGDLLTQLARKGGFSHLCSQGEELRKT